jgi:3-deoxy-D-manno-octulosonic-acid transferase
MNFVLRFLYRALLVLALPFLPLRLWWRGRKNPLYRYDIGERFGFDGRALPAPGAIWIHAVSVGETRAAAPVIAALRKRHPETTILVTHMTATGRATGAELFKKYGAGVVQSWLPYDYRFAVRRFLKRWQPKAALLMETEVWPTVIEECRRSKIPCFLINARLSARSARGYLRFASFTKPVFAQLAGVAAQTGDDASRLAEVGATNITVTGNVKFDITPPQSKLALGAAFKRVTRGRQVFLCASTRDGEEALILDAWSAGKLPESSVLVIVPRHPERFDAVAKMLSDRRIPYMRRSWWSERALELSAMLPAETRAVLGDSMGELFAYYAAADVAFIGGSLLPLGGQNLLESIAAGVPTLVGEHTFNFKEITETAVACGAARRVKDAGELMTQAAALLGDADGREAMEVAGEAFLKRHQGATERVMEWLEGKAEG